MRTLTILIVFLELSTEALANDSMVSENLVDTVICCPQKQKQIPFDSVVAGFDKLLAVSEELIGTVKDGIAKEGVAGYIRKHLNVFAPLIAFVLLYAVWLVKRERS